MLSLGSIIREHLPFFIFAFGAFGATIFILSGIYIRNSMKNKIRRCTSSVIANAYDVFSSGEGLGDQRVRFKYTVNGVEYTNLHPVILNLSKIQLEKPFNADTCPEGNHPLFICSNFATLYVYIALVKSMEGKCPPPLSEK